MKAGLLRLFAALLGLLPPRLSAQLAKPLAFCLWHLSTRLREASRVNLRLAFPDLDPAERERLGRMALWHYARNALEIGIAWRWSQARFKALFEPPVGISLIAEARARGRGVILLAPHHGSWELAGLAFSDWLDGATLYKPSGNSALDALLAEKRGRFGANPVPATPAGLRELLQSLRTGRGVAVLPDQEPKAGDGRFAPFFGVPALTGVLTSRLLQKTGAEALFAMCLREAHGRYRLHVIKPDPDLQSPDLDTALAALNRGVESCIALAPEQYLWAYKRYRARPEGEPRLY